MEGDIPSTPTPNYDWSGHINNDPPQDDNAAGESDPESEQNNEDPTGPTTEEIDRNSLLGIKEIYGPINPTSGTIEPEVISKFTEFTGQDMPQEIIDKLQTSGYTKPWQIINLFGGNQKTLVRFFCYNQPSVFLTTNYEYTGNLFQVSRILLQETLQRKTYPPHYWITTKKRPTFDNEFMNMNAENIREQCETDEYEHDIVAYFNSIQTLITDIANREDTQDNEQEREPEQPTNVTQS